MVVFWRVYIFFVVNGWYMYMYFCIVSKSVNYIDVVCVIVGKNREI